MTATSTRLAIGQFSNETQVRRADAIPFPDDHRYSETQHQSVVGDTIPTVQTLRAARVHSDGGSLPDTATADTEPTPHMPCRGPLNGVDYWQDLRIWAETYADLQQQRIAVQNRVSHAPVEADAFLDALSGIAHSEHQLALGMRRAFRRSGFREWQQQHKGIGEHLLARLLGHLGDPCVRITRDGEVVWRSVSQLWSLCGHGDPSRRRRKGMSQEDALKLGSPALKMLTHLLAEACMKQKPRDGEPASTFRGVYDARRAATAAREDWTDGHKHNDALRIVGKHILKSLWIEARRLHHI